MHANSSHLAGALLAGALSLLSLTPASAAGPACPGNPDALGTSRVLPVDTSHGLFVGTKSYPATLPLEDHEIVLTFDDGPGGKPTDDVLAALAHHCVKATFFLVGEMAKADPDQVRRIAAAGHTVGHHTMTHKFLNKLYPESAEAEISNGWKADDTALYGKAGDRPVTPFFRYPGFAGTPQLDTWLAGQGIGVFGADWWGSDWDPIDSDKILALSLERIEKMGRGIFLLHDIKPKTAAMVPRLLDELKRRGFHIVHIVPAKAG
jgi:peptidoglycan/xylan/chitin deacetylase (PgdA/CDA1 family)